MCYCQPNLRTPFCGTWECAQAGMQNVKNENIELLKKLDDARIRRMEDDRKMDEWHARSRKYETLAITQATRIGALTEGLRFLLDEHKDCGCEPGDDTSPPFTCGYHLLLENE